jgi:hypothetical protein
MSQAANRPSIDVDGWQLLSGEEAHAAHPDTFYIPPATDRATLNPGDGVQLLFDIERKEGGAVIDRGVDRLWVIIKARISERYLGVLDNDPGSAANLTLREGDVITFGPEHVIDISRPPREYVVEKYGPEFFAE